MLWQPDILAEVTLLSTAAGGRHGPTPADSFGCPLCFGGEYFDIRFDLSDIGHVAPGMTVRVPAKFLFPELIKPRLAVGSEFSLWEMRTIGIGKVIVYE